MVGAEIQKRIKNIKVEEQSHDDILTTEHKQKLREKVKEEQER